MWTWVNAGSSAGNYGVQGYEAAANVPSGRYRAQGWRDATGNLWLFGGSGTGGFLSDLWRFNISTGAWTWVKGQGTGGVAGSYGTLGVTSTNSAPGARANGVTWTDKTGHMWLFGGIGADSTGTIDRLNDLWRIDP